MSEKRFVQVILTIAFSLALLMIIGVVYCAITGNDIHDFYCLIGVPFQVRIFLYRLGM